MKKKKVEISEIRNQIIKKRELKEKLKKRIKVLYEIGDMNLYNAATAALESVLSDLKALHDKEVVYEAKAPQRAIEAAKNEAQRINDKLDVQFLYSLTI